MIDPDALNLTKNPLPSLIKINNVVEFDYEPYDYNDDKDLNNFFKDVEKVVRHSIEYKNYIKYLRENMDMNKCLFLKGVDNIETFDIKIELHHYPFTLRDIVEIVYRKRCYYNEYISVFMVAKEVMELHYKLMIGLVPLSETVHELAHKGKIFIPITNILGRYNLFIEYYKPFIDSEHLDAITRMEVYTEENNSILDTTILDTNKVNYEIKDKRYMLPEMNKVNDAMFDRLALIKANNYLLPDISNIEELNHEKKVISPISFDFSLISHSER